MNCHVSDLLALPEDDLGETGAPENETKITPEMIDTGLVRLYAFNPETSDGKDTVREIIKSALATLPLFHGFVG